MMRVFFEELLSNVLTTEDGTDLYPTHHNRRTSMKDLDVRIVELAPMRMISAYGFGESPEAIAWDKLLTWARDQGMDLAAARYFGFNNPSPSPGSPNYGYEQWMTVDEDVTPAGDLRIVDFSGGRYAVTRCKLPQIGAAWRALVAWCEDHAYRSGTHQCLEESITPVGDTSFEEVVMDIYLPIVG
jgi:effector-binding domain-containing protein